MDADDRLARDNLEPDSGGRVIVEALGKADVLVADRIANAALNTLAVRGVADPARQVPQIGAVGAAVAVAPVPPTPRVTPTLSVTPTASVTPTSHRREGHPLDSPEHLSDGGRTVDDLPSWAGRALLHRVAAAELDRVPAESSGQ